jgi:hypothetical protein
MAIMQAVFIRPRSGDVWDELQKQLSKTSALLRKHGVEMTMMVSVIGGEQTNTLSMLATAESWTKFGELQEKVLGDPEMQALMAESGKIATWETYVAQTIDL